MSQPRQHRRQPAALHCRAPDNPEATTRVLATDAPPPGLTRTVEVLEVARV